MLPVYINKLILGCAFIALRVQSTSPIIFEKQAFDAICAFRLAYNYSVYGNVMFTADIWIIPSHAAGMARLSQLLLKWSSGNEVQCGKSMAPGCGHRSMHNAMRTVLGNLNLMSQLSSGAKKVLLVSVNSCHCCFLNHFTYTYALICTHVIAKTWKCQLFVSNMHITLRNALFDINSFPASLLKVTMAQKCQKFVSPSQKVGLEHHADAPFVHETPGLQLLQQTSTTFTPIKPPQLQAAVMCSVSGQKWFT